eukprot:3395129-Pleurochrysis_carterae.AAC.1
MARAKLSKKNADSDGLLITPSQRSDAFNSSGGRIADLNEIAKLRASIRELKDAAQQQQNEMAMLKAQVQTFDAHIRLA